MPKSNSQLFEEIKALMPSVDNILKEGLGRLQVSKEPLEAGTIKASFSDLLFELEKVCYEIYQKYEQEHGEKVVQKFFAESGTKSIFTELDRFFLSMTQSRRSRAGKTFEASLELFLKHCGYVFEEQPIINGKPDFVLPSKEHYLRNAPDCIVLTAKRTLRERWKQIATEGTRGKKALFLATLDKEVSQGGIQEMLGNGIYLVIPKNLKETNKAYRKADNVISFESFFMDHLDPAMDRWKRNGVL